MSPLAPEPGPAAIRWKKLVNGRMAEMRRLAPDRESASRPGFWNSRARRASPAMSYESAGEDPFLRRLRREVSRRDTVIDAGAGSGRFALRLAPRVREVVAVDHSDAMLRRLRRQARDLGVENVRTVASRWEDAEVQPGDFAFSSYVLPVVADAPRFLLKLDAAATKSALLYLSAFGNDALLDPLWRHFHDRPRRPAPTYIDVLELLKELGIKADVEVVTVASKLRYRTIGEAVRDYRSYLLLGGQPGAGAELRRLLKVWLVEDDDGYRPPVRTMPAAIISWRPGRRRRTMPVYGRNDAG